MTHSKCREPSPTDCITMAANVAGSVAHGRDTHDLITGYLIAMASVQTDSTKAQPWWDAVKFHMNCSDEYIATTILGG